ncbi:MAG: dephospho-CoA kinase [Desulfosarcina sp.]|nr:dephospho-CoA kinase [Desulfobacterales bacterium]
MAMLPPSYQNLEGLIKKLRGNDNRLLLGVTGGIASGKTTVAKMLEEFGAPIVDFDLLSRKVVEPGKPAWKKIVEYFGKQVLQDNETLDRKKLSDIVFGDPEKRKKLESFTHPEIYDEFIEQVNQIASATPDPVIQVVIPLLIEVNLTYIFDKILVVYIPQEMQIERLAQRDGISAVEAANILKSQLPIDEKIRFADFKINNANSLKETEAQVKELWKTLKDIQQEQERT